jgi:protein SCO1/2
MKRLLTALLLTVVTVACGGSEAAAPKPLSVPGEKLYTIRGKVVARDAADNTLRVDHEAIPGFMEAMTMDYSVRGANVAGIAPDKSRLEAKLHVTDDAYWLTDVKTIP